MSFRSRIPLAVCGILALAGLLPAAASSAQDGAEVAILALEARDRGGQTLTDVDAAELSATADGEDLAVLSVGDPTDWEVVIYVDQQLSASRSILLLLEALAAQSADLTQLGEVQIVLADEEPTSLLRTRDPELLGRALADLSLRSTGEHALQHGRTSFLRRAGAIEDQSGEAAELEMAEELELLRDRQDQLTHWIGTHGRPTRPRVMLFLNDSLGLDPFDFYRDYLSAAESVRFELGEPPSPETLAQTLTSYGWTLLPVIVPADPDADTSGVSLRTNQSIGFRIGIGGGNRDAEDEEPLPDLGLDSGRDGPLEALAASTGGFLTTDLELLPEAIDRLAGRREVRVTAQAAANPIPLTVSTIRPGVEILAPSWIGGSPESVAEVRIRRSLEGQGEAGDLALRAKISLDPERLAVKPADLDLLVDLSGVPPSALPIPVRVSIGIHRQDGDLLLRHRVVEASANEGTTWHWQDSLPLPPSTDAAVVVVHDLRRDVWGENFAEFITGPETAAAEVAPTPVAEAAAPLGPALRLLPLPSNVGTGKVKVRSEARSDVDEVIFMLDGERVGTRRRSPFDMRIDLGRIPNQRSIIAIAYDDSGTEIGRDGLVVNEAATTFWVHITEPRPGRQVGPVDVATSVKTPDGRRLDSVEYYWNDQKVASTRAAPHRSRVLIPVDQPAGFIRVVATLDDGTTAEDVVLMNTQRFETEINVELVELYVVVTDRLGKPVQGLDSSDFRVREEEEVQEVESFVVAGDLPLTLGLAIDSSLSLFKKLPDVQQAASHFVDSLSGERDRAFLVGFGSTPRLVHSTTRDLGRIHRAIGSLEPSGNTAVWEAITLSLDQLNKEAGRKALVVFYDGDDEDEQYSFRKTMELARRSLIPVYLIVMNDEAARTQGKGFAVRSRIAKLDELARTGGGRVFYVHTDQDLTPIFDEVAEELRSHYLLTYYPQRPLANPEWRPIQVEVTRSDLTARTISGYGGG